MADPYSVARVLPDKIAETYPGVTLTHVSVELTDDQPSTGIELHLPWLKSGLPKGDLPIETVEAHPRSKPIRLTTLDFWIKG
jgi:hypothetical protein